MDDPLQNQNAIKYRESIDADLSAVKEFLTPYIQARQILPRTDQEFANILTHGFVASDQEKIVGFAAVEVYSNKLAELQCLAVDPNFRRLGIGRELVSRCVDRASSLNVLELMAISASEDLFKSCGFDYSLPNQKRALFIQTRDPDRPGS